MARPKLKAFYDSAIWKKQRSYILKRDKYCCTEPGCLREGTEVHHIIELNEKNVDDVNVSLNEDNLRTLCHTCHTRITKQMKSNSFDILPKIMFDEQGYPVRVDE